MVIALGVMGMTVMEFEEMLLHDFFLKLYYHNLKEEHSYRTTAELVRLQTLTLVNIQLLKKDKIKDPRLLWVFPWERDRLENTQERKEMNIDSIMKMGKLL